MKRKITLLLCAAVGALSMNAQVLFSENFTATFTPSSAGWAMTNLSSPVNSTVSPWFQGNGTGVFPAFNGAANDYFASNYQMIAAGQAGTISSWLITPTLSLFNGAVIQFASRTTTSSTIYPDRLQLNMSTAGTSTNVGATATSVGDFSTTLVDINPSLTTTGYPTVWTIYSATLTGITGTVTGRFGFRYFVTNGGPNGANSDYIGIDAVQYSSPCTAPSVNISASSSGICSGNSTTLTASGATNYTWSAGSQTATSISVSPATSTTYTLFGETAGCVGTTTAAITVTATPVLSISSVTTCAGTSTTLQPTGAAASYSWNTGATTQAIVVAPTSNTTYTVTGTNGTCSGSATVSVSMGSNLSVNVSASSSSVCSGNSATLTASGATTYSWNTGATTAVIVVTPSANATYSVGGVTGTCFGGNTVAITVAASPTVTASSSASIACTSSTVALTGSGATSYTWALGTQTATFNPISLNTGTATGVITLTLTGANANGCKASTVLSQTITNCTGIDAVEANASKVSAYPNPFTSELTISGVTGSVKIFNTLGQLVATSAVNENETINTSGLAKGVYIVKAFDTEGKEVKTIRVIKN